MKKTTKTLGSLSILSAAVMLAGCPFDNDKNDDPVAVAPVSIPANLLLTSNRLAAADLGVASEGSVILGDLTGVVAGDQLVSIDRRPSNGQLYALGFNATNGTVRLYAVHPASLRAVPLTDGAATFGGLNPPVAGVIGGADATIRATTRFEIDFNPAVDRLRIISSRGENFRMDPNTGLLVQGTVMNMQDGALSQGTSFAGTAYTNSQIVTTNPAITAQYTISDGADATLFLQSNPNMGTLDRINALSPRPLVISGFDVAAGLNASASNMPVTAGNAFALTGTTSQNVATINLITGAVTEQRLGSTTGAIGLAVQKPLDVPVIALADNGTQLVRFEASNPARAVATAAITGLTSGETLVGIDFRPATGQLFGLGIDHTANTGSLYRLDLQNGGAAVLVGAASSIRFVADDGTTAIDLPDPATADYGVDFNPVPDALRVTTSTGLNLRIAVGTGTPGTPADGNNGRTDPATFPAGVQPDGALNGATMQGAGAAYTNSFGGATVTSLYILNSNTDALTIQSPPNGGTQVAVANVTLNGAPLNFTAVPGFDIQPEVRVTSSNAVASGVGYALLTVNGTTNLYRINLTTGAAQLLGTPPGTGFRGLAVGSTGNVR